MKIKDILNLNGRDLLSMTEKELKDVANALTSASNKRIRRIEESGVGYASPAVNARRRKSGKVVPFSTKMPKYLSKRTSEEGKRKDERARKQRYRDLILSERDFLSSESGSVAGAKRSARALAGALGTDYDKLTIAQQRKFWKAYEKFRKDNPQLIRALTGGYSYEKAREKVFSIVVRNTKKGFQVRTDQKMLDFIRKTFEKQYERQMMNSPYDSPLSTGTDNDTLGGLEILGDEEE